MMYEEIFGAASAYDFESIVQYEKSGGELNSCNSSGESLLKVFLESYCDSGDPPSEQEKAEAEHQKSMDINFEESYLYETQKTPLKDRKSKILDQLDWFMAHSADVNLCKMVDKATETPLYIAVVQEDCFLTEYLLAHGANPKLWLFEEEKLYKDYGYWLMEHMDVELIDARGERADNCLKIAALLAHYGLDEFDGFCLSVNKETRTVSSHPLGLKY